MTYRLQIVLAMANRYDYAEFTAACKAEDVQRMSWPEYTQKITALDYAEMYFPDLPPLDAYKAYVASNNNTVGEPLGIYAATPQRQTGCGSCGGGRTR